MKSKIQESEIEDAAECESEIVSDSARGEFHGRNDAVSSSFPSEVEPG